MAAAWEMHGAQCLMSYLWSPLSTARFVSRYAHREAPPRRESVRFPRLYELLAWRCAGAEFTASIRCIAGVRGPARDLLRARALSSFVCVCVCE